MELLEWIELNASGEKTRLRERRCFPGMFFMITALITLAFVTIYGVLSRDIYFWDNATYWEMGRMLSKMPLNNQFFNDVWKSVSTTDYNYLAALPVALWMKLFGTTRLSYLICIVLIYVVPAQAMLYKTAREFSKVPEFAYVIALLSIPAYVYMTCIGFVDVGGVFLGLCCYYLYFKNTQKKSREYVNGIITGLLLVLMMVFRRYFAFFAVSFITAMVTDCILYKSSWKKLLITSLTAAFFATTVFNGFVMNILIKNYAVLYSGYKYSAMTDVKLIARYFGIVTILMLVGMVIYSVVRKKDNKCVFALIQAMVCVLMFASTQTHGQQHLLLYVPPFFIIIISGLNAVNKRWMLVTICVIALINFISPFVDREQPNNIKDIKYPSLIPTYSVKPPIREDAAEVMAVKIKLDRVIPEDKKCGIIASSFILNTSILMNVEPSLNQQEGRGVDYLVGMPEVDSRDFWRLKEIYESDYLLVATPAQTHLAEGKQRIVEETVKSFNEGTDIATAFEQVREFNAEIGDITLKLYRRKGIVTDNMIKAYESRLNLKGV